MLLAMGSQHDTIVLGEGQSKRHDSFGSRVVNMTRLFWVTGSQHDMIILGHGLSNDTTALSHG